MMPDPKEVVAGMTKAQISAVRYLLEWSSIADNYYLGIETKCVSQATIKALSRKGIVGQFGPPFYRAWLTEIGNQVRTLLLERN